MSSAILVLTDQGLRTAQRILDTWSVESKGGSAESTEGLPALWVNEKCKEDLSGSDFLSDIRFFTKVKDVLPGLWEGCSALIFIMATGIVVRHIAPLIKRKDKDPAVLVLDEKGEFVISLLSGHLGGANALSKVVAEGLGAQAVITTATDVRGITAPDEYARRLGWKVEPIRKLPEVNRFLLDRGYLKIWSEVELSLENPLLKDKHYRFVSDSEKSQADLWITYRNYRCEYVKHKKNTPLLLRPQCLSVGVGCRRGVSKAQVLQAIKEGLKQIDTSEQCIKGIYSIDLKADEIGIREAASELGVPFQTFAKDLVQRMNEEKVLASSNFVKDKIGVDGVCEATSLLGTKQGILLLPKQKMNGVTIAISQEKYL